MSNSIHHQNWRYATKKFDTSKKIPDADLNILKEAIRLSSSSYGLQPYKILIIENPDLRVKLKAAAWGQNQITDASLLIIFATEINIGDLELDTYISHISKTR